MHSASHYHRCAEECRAIARKVADPEHKRMLEQMAQTWESLASDRGQRNDRPA